MEGQINIKVKPGAGGRQTREKRNSRIKRTTKSEGRKGGIRVGTVIYQDQIGISMVACTEQAKYRPVLFQLSSFHRAHRFFISLISKSFHRDILVF